MTRPRCCKQDCTQSCACTPRPPAPLRLAPGVLQGYRPGLLGSAAQRRELARLLRRVAAGLVVLALASVAAGYLVGMLP